ncbi:hypothetical protein CB1_035581001 [Camelus ferus]|nr:hypothetical protein CB1_035581001 [Camelus ferus]
MIRESIYLISVTYENNMEKSEDIDFTILTYSGLEELSPGYHSHEAVLTCGETRSERGAQANCACADPSCAGSWTSLLLQVDTWREAARSERVAKRVGDPDFGTGAESEDICYYWKWLRLQSLSDRNKDLGAQRRQGET